ncbi:MAG: carboxypeptidase regulatory-like domain-containing protein [Planctomycetes bacterium]|nr:carboxypeptidase regulatory-like domain-containing protein [Planctomycetota bacterium]
MSWLYRAAAAALAGVLVVLAGCDRPRSQVSGTVRHKGTPLPKVFVIAIAADNQTYTAATGPDGRYALTGVPRGAIRVAVQVPESAPPQGEKGAVADRSGSKSDDDAITKGGKAASSPPARPRPELAKYLDPNTSGLSFDLRDPEQTYDINLD